ncbi:glucoamylase [Singulisphaera sp. GP187]|uniref:glycoside hydrolase family 15 protein n=1 Tax=Singulisphaera sp. GP187 TaxID=1882752 RepID=UPI0009260977|nr:glycoside hydrolase family 15 protein [Singulisphaera sp. GP187]SIO57722.1 glucoamylase [Singulisphaera sp. GP187]
MATDVQVEVHARAKTTAEVAGRPRFSPHVAFEPTELTTIAYPMFMLMMRNVATDTFVFIDPNDSTIVSQPGCILAAPSYPAFLSGVDQDYVYNWTRDGAIAAMEIAAARIPPLGAPGVQPLIDYVRFAQTCQNNAAAAGIFARASFTINGQPRQDWTDQNDGAALQTLAVLKAYDQLDAPTQAIAKQVINKNLNFLLQVYKDETFNLWEEHFAFSFFARSAQLKCFQAIQSNTIGIAVPSGTGDAITFLKSALASHWDGQYYLSLLDTSGQPPVSFYDPNIDIVSACLYGAIPCTDTKLLATAALLRSQWADDSSAEQYPINHADAALGLGPLLGRYPGDLYDGDSHDNLLGRHPWALCTCNLAELYYTLANEITRSNSVPLDSISAPFFQHFNVTFTTPIATVVAALQDAADAMLRAVVYHSDHLELSEQYDGVSGFEKSVKNLTWSYAAFLSAVRAKTGKNL